MSLKRKRPVSDGKDLRSDERAIYDLIHSKGDMGVWKGDIKKESGISNPRTVDNAVKSLLAKQMIKEVADIQAKGRKRLLAKDFEPSKDLTGGDWYHEGTLDVELINRLKDISLKALATFRISTVDGIRNYINKSGALMFNVNVEQVKEILENMVLDKAIVRERSNGIGEFAPFPINANCYKPKQKSARVGAMASVPCGVCPRINQCSPEGIISPTTCEYYTKWLDF